VYSKPTIRFAWLLSFWALASCSSDLATRRDAPGNGAGTGGTSVIGAGGTLNPGNIGAPANIAPGGNNPFVRSCGVGECADFPADPIKDGPVPDDAPTRFGSSPPTGSGLCIVEPQDNALFPANWVRPRFRVTAPGMSLFEIRLHTDREKNDLVVYTTNNVWTMPKEIWQGLTRNAFDEPITVAIRGLGGAGSSSPVGMSIEIKIAPVEAGGSMVYWAADGPYMQGGNTWLVGFGVGEEGTVDALKINQLAAAKTLDDNGTLKRAESFGGNSYALGQVRCIGCHTSTPDGDAVAFTDSWPWDSLLAGVKADTVGQRPSYVTDAGALLANQAWLGAATFSKGDWATGARIMVTSFGNPNGVGWPGTSFNKSNQDRLAWIDLATTVSLPPPGSDPGMLNAAVAKVSGTAFGFLSRSGDTRGAVNPDWSHDGTRIAYTSTDKTLDGHAGGSAGQAIQADIYTVPYNNRAGGTATPLTGAAAADALEYYPDFSADDQFIAFTRAAATTGLVYYRPDAEIHVVSSMGGVAKRLSANDPPSCGGQSSPGQINSWPKWSPSVGNANGQSYYWLVFSSARSYPEQFTLPKDQFSPPDTRSSQLYIAGVVVKDGAIIEDHPGIYIWNQTKNTTNLTPAWDEFQIPPAIVR
jgi:hypothetical protein